MTDQELSQIRQIVREELQNSVPQIVREEIAAQLPPRLDRAVEAMGTDFSELR